MLFLYLNTYRLYIPIHTIPKEIDNMLLYNEDKAEAEIVLDLIYQLLIDIYLETTKEEGDLID